MNTTSLYFHPGRENEQLFCRYMTVIGVCSVLINFLMFYMSTRYTPNSMLVYRYTVKNSTFWSTLVVIQTCFVLRPIPYFPFYVAKADGLSFLVGSYWLASIQWYMLIAYCVNLNTAFVICYSGLFFFLTDPWFLKYLTQRIVWFITISSHLISTGFILVVLNFFYRFDPNFTTRLLKDYPEFNQVFDPNKDVLFGFYPVQIFPLMSIACCFFAVLVATYFIVGFGFIIASVFDGINRPDKQQTHKFRKHVTVMLAIRCLIPMFLLTIPLIILTTAVWLDLRYSWNFYITLLSMILVHGMFTTIGTLMVFKPYRDGFVNFFKSGKQVSTAIFSFRQKSTIQQVTPNVSFAPAESNISNQH